MKHVLTFVLKIPLTKFSAFLNSCLISPNHSYILCILWDRRNVFIAKNRSEDKSPKRQMSTDVFKYSIFDVFKYAIF